MIRQIKTEAEFSALPLSGVSANKIRALYLAYGTGYDFCRFYRQNDSVYFSLLDGAAVICGEPQDYSELAEFLMFSGYTGLFCDYAVGERLSQLLGFTPHRVNLMKFCGEAVYSDLITNPPLSEVYDILKDGFEISFEPWYLDMSHRVRHGISACYTLGNASTLTVQHNLNGEVLISQVATRAERQGQGSASRLIRAVCALYPDSGIFIVCEDELIPFYEKIGFRFVSRCIN